MIFIYLLLTIFTFFSLRYLLSFIDHPLANPLLWSIILLVSVFSFTTLNFNDYQRANIPVQWLLETAVVALAIPLFSQIQLLKKHIYAISFCCFISVIIAMASGTLIAMLLTDDKTLLMSLLPKSVTAPIAMDISQSMQGMAPLTAGVVICVGLFGAVAGVSLLRLFKINTPQAQGLAMGSAAHTLGTAAILKEGETQGAFGSIALVLCGIFTAILAPIFAWLITHFL